MNVIKLLPIVLAVSLSGCRTIVVPTSFAERSFVDPYEPGSIELGSRVAAVSCDEFVLGLFQTGRASTQLAIDAALSQAPGAIGLANMTVEQHLNLYGPAAWGFPYILSFESRCIQVEGKPISRRKGP